MAESLIAATLGAELTGTFNDPEYRPPPLGDAVDEFDLEVSRAELGLSELEMQRIIADAEITVPDILWL